MTGFSRCSSFWGGAIDFVIDVAHSSRKRVCTCVRAMGYETRSRYEPLSEHVATLSIVRCAAEDDTEGRIVCVAIIKLSLLLFVVHSTTNKRLVLQGRGDTCMWRSPGFNNNNVLLQFQFWERVEHFIPNERMTRTCYRHLSVSQLIALSLRLLSRVCLYPAQGGKRTRWQSITHTLSVRQHSSTHSSLCTSTYHGTKDA